MRVYDDEVAVRLHGALTNLAYAVNEMGKRDFCRWEKVEESMNRTVSLLEEIDVVLRARLAILKASGPQDSRGSSPG